jgi:hypothetical protein
MANTNELFNSEVFGKRNFDALDAVYTADARILPPGAPMISGREAIKKFWTDLVQSVNAKSAVLSSVEFCRLAMAWSKSVAPRFRLSPKGKRS